MIGYWFGSLTCFGWRVVICNFLFCYQFIALLIANLIHYNFFVCRTYIYSKIMAHSYHWPLIKLYKIHRYKETTINSNINKQINKHPFTPVTQCLMGP